MCVGPLLPIQRSTSGEHGIFSLYIMSYLECARHMECLDSAAPQLRTAPLVPIHRCTLSVRGTLSAFTALHLECARHLECLYSATP